MTPTPMLAAQPSGESAMIAMALDTSQPYAGDPTLTDIPPTISTGHKEITEAGLTGEAAATTQATQQRQAVLQKPFQKLPPKHQLQPQGSQDCSQKAR